ncbi:MAG: DsrE/DsrF/DrsH-like family protein [Bacteroidales bacterium]|nr:DsrE/DsrF/DrsH-like family protein [Bacteroidales bacterium]
MESNNPIKKVNIICAKAAIEDVYAALVMGNGAVMEGIEANLFFTFFGLDALVKNRMDKPHTSVVGNPGLRLPGGLRMPTLLGVIPGMEAMTSSMMLSSMEKLDIPPVSEFLELIKAGGGKVYACKLGMDMFKFTKEDLWDDVDGVLTVGEFYALAGGEGSHIIFT